jgi:molybdenum cofactor cytidylyltransferase
MRFGHIPLDEAVGAISAHAVKAGEVVLRKDSRVTVVIVGRLKVAGQSDSSPRDPADVHEDEAAATLANRLAGKGIRVEPPFTGRANLFAEHNGVLLLERSRIDRINAAGEAITVATLPEFGAVSAGEILATVKIIPYAAALSRGRRR